MPRTVIDFPATIHFSTDYTVLISDINSANHLGADKLFAIMIEAQMRFFADLGYAQSSEIEGATYIMGDAEFIFRAESHYADQLTIDVAVCNFGDKSFELRYRITNQQKATVAAYIKAGMVFLNPDSGKTCAVPAAFKKQFI